MSKKVLRKQPREKEKWTTNLAEVKGKARSEAI